MAETNFYVDINMQGNRVRNGSASLVGTDFVIRNELDAATANLDWKQSVRAASTANINLAAPGATIDGVSMNVGERFLPKNQTTASENGIYVWNGAAVPATRAEDANTSAEVTSQLVVSVSEGTTNADTSWRLVTDDPITLDVTNLVFAAFSTASGVESFTADIGDGVATSFVVNHALNNNYPLVQIMDNSTEELVNTTVVLTDANNVTVTFNSAPANNAFKVIVHG